jgi:hypothetical protein
LKGGRREDEGRIKRGRRGRVPLSFKDSKEVFCLRPKARLKEDKGRMKGGRREDKERTKGKGTSQL